MRLRGRVVEGGGRGSDGGRGGEVAHRLWRRHFTLVVVVVVVTGVVGGSCALRVRVRLEQCSGLVRRPSVCGERKERT